ncbi:hypothetical protein [Roseateles sp.]|uniref:hypothetical protein n=1 Tax=Roseateles sp. TaxID=1971397 RepID=UPI0031CF8BE2
MSVPSSADVLVVPFLPRSIDVWALDDMAHLVDEARSVRDGLRALAVLSMADPAGADNAAAAHLDFHVNARVLHWQIV